MVRSISHGRRHDISQIEEGAAMDTGQIEGLAGSIRERGGRTEAADPAGADLLGRAEEAVAHARRLRAGTHAVLAEFDELRRRVGIAARPAP